MKHIQICCARGQVVALIIAAVLPFRALAEDNWKHEASINLWLPSVGGETSFPPSGGGPTIDITSDKVIDALKMAFMGTFDIKKGEWGTYIDVAYVDLGNSKYGSRDFLLGGAAPAGLSANLSLDIKALSWTLAGYYSLVATPSLAIDVVAGARLLELKESLDYQLNGTGGSGVALPARTGSSEDTQSNWDAVIGIKGRVSLGANRKWFIPYYLDIGTGDSEFTWQGAAGAGYQFKWGSVSATWRHLDYQLSGTPVESVNFDGPAIVAAFQW